MEDTQNQGWHPDVRRRPEFAGKKCMCYSPDDRMCVVEYDENGYVAKWYWYDEPQKDIKSKLVTLENLKYFATRFKENLDARYKGIAQRFLVIIFALFVVLGTMGTLIAIQVRQLDQSLTELERQIDETSEALDSFETGIMDSLTDLQDQINSLREEVNELEEAVQ